MKDPAGRLSAALADRYTIERELGAGGMATVYLAADLKHDRLVAIKTVRPELAASLGAERFLREIRIAAKLQHPHILPLYDSGAVGDILFYVMPYVEGESLRDRMDRERQLPISDALDITRQVASALSYAHSHDVIHRDIKPENILLSGDGAMVADFGIAVAMSTATSKRLTETGASVGTPYYMSPEQAMGERTLDARTDVYSLGCVLYEMLAGEPPYSGPTAHAVIVKRLTDPVPGVRHLRGAVPAGVEQALMKALATVAADRFASAGAFAEALSKPAGADPRPPSVAVLPFRNLSADPENEYFADGITEDVIAQLSKIRALKVISRTSVMPFKNREQSLREIGARLGAATLLEGSVRRAGDRVRIVAQLIDAETDQHLWAETYDRQLTDIFAIQSDVAMHIVAALEAELSPGERMRIGKEPTSDVEAYQLYLQGRHCLNRYTEEGFRKGIDYLGRAIAKDPGYALAYARMAMAYIELGQGQGAGILRPDQAYRSAKDAAAKALALDSGLGEAHCALGYLAWVSDFDWKGAEEEFKRALELSPGSADTYDIYGRMCSAMGRYDEAISLERHAQALDPVAHRSDVATTLLRAGRYDDALREATRAVELDPQYARGRATLGWAFLKKGSHREGLDELERAVSLGPGETQWLAQLGQAYALSGKGTEARAVLRQLEEWATQRYVSPYHVAYVYAGLGEQDRAIDCLERAYEERAAVHGIKGSFLFTTLRAHPGFTALLRKMNLD
jgi:serine/threonine-protein kinase